MNTDTNAATAVPPQSLQLDNSSSRMQAKHILRIVSMTIVLGWIVNELHSGYTNTSKIEVSTPDKSAVDTAVAEEDSLLKTMYPLRDLTNFTKTIKYSGRTFSKAGCIDFVCNKDIESCDNTLPTNYDDIKPPCCTHILRDMAHTFDKVMSKLGLQYIVSFGTLLGLIRSDKIIPWTADDDFVIFNDGNLANMAMLSLWDNSTGLNFVTYPWPPRLCITSAFANGNLQRWSINSPRLASLKMWKKGYPYGDVYAMTKLTNELIGGEYPNCKHRYADIYPIERRMVYNNSFALNFPARPEDLLKRYYGLEWETPPVRKNAHGGTSSLLCKDLFMEESRAGKVGI